MNTVFDPKTFHVKPKMAPQAFFAWIMPLAKSEEERTASLGKRIPAAFTAIQAALESGWNGSALSQFANNFFGIKGDDGEWSGDTFEIPTREVIGGKSEMILAKFRAYATPSDGLAGHSDFLMDNPRYAAAFKTSTPEAFAQAIADAGYATDPNYAQSLIATMHSHAAQLQ